MPDIDPHLPSKAQLLERARALLDQPDMADVGHSEYDAGFLARVAKPGTREPAFPEVLEVVRTTQAEDGGWAPEVDYVSARLLATLSSMLAVIEFDNGPEARARADRAAAFVLKSWPRLKDEPDLTIGFELVAAPLLAEVCERGFSNLHALSAAAEALHKEKMSRVPPQMLYAPHLSLGFSLEFLRDKLDVEQARKLQTANGLVGASVATTAHFVQKSGDERALRGLRELVDRRGPRSIPFGTGTELWQRLWIAYHLHMAGMSPELQPELKPHLEAIRSHTQAFGLAWSSEVAYGDSDDTSVSSGLLHDHGYEVNWKLLAQYERPDGFVGFLVERGASVSANAHVLDAIQGRPYPGGQDSVDKSARFLLSQRRQDGFWTDKWHASVYYVTSRATRALLRWDASCVVPSVQWLQANQRTDGGWGWFGRSSPEETAYALHALAAARLAGLSVDAGILAKGTAYLAPYDGSEPSDIHPKLWIAKGLYRPLHVVRSTVLAAQVMVARALAMDGTSAKPSRLAVGR